MEANEQATVPATASELESLAHLLAEIYRGRVQSYVQDAKFSPEDAVAIQAPIQRSHLDSLEHTPLAEVSWDQLEAAAALDPDRAVAEWTSMKAEARQEIANGSRAADVLAAGQTPMERARLLAQSAAMRDDAQPRPGIESALVEAAALAFTEHLAWMRYAHVLAVNEAREQQQNVEFRGVWDPPRLTQAESRRQAAEMADRYHRMFLRNVRALRDLRRTTPAVMVQSAGQVNVGAQQVNVRAGPSS